MELHPDNRDSATIASFYVRRILTPPNTPAAEVASTAIGGFISGMTAARNVGHAAEATARALDAVHDEEVQQSLETQARRIAAKVKEARG